MNIRVTFNLVVLNFILFYFIIFNSCNAWPIHSVQAGLKILFLDTGYCALDIIVVIIIIIIQSINQLSNTTVLVSIIVVVGEEEPL